MNDAAVHALARRAGIAVEWRDYANKPHRVSIETLRRILAALGLPCSSDEDVAVSERQLERPGWPALITATIGEPIDITGPRGAPPKFARIVHEDGSVADLWLRRTGRGVQVAGVDKPGYHSLDIGDARVKLAVAPPRCITVGDLAPDARLWGLAVQAYGLRRAGDCGIGDMASVAALAREAAALNADALALSPMHALFAADPKLYSPYAPSSRLFYNPLYADPRGLFGEERVQKAISESGIDARVTELEQQTLIDWPQSAAAKLAVFRSLFDDFAATDLADGKTPLAVDFAAFTAAGGSLLEDHARFEALHAAALAADPSAFAWRDWPSHWRNPHDEAVASFARAHRNDVLFHCFLQWIADRSLAAAQQETKAAGMRIGLVADLAVGMSAAGSHAWTNQNDILGGLEIGAPPDLYNRKGQNWGLTTFSPRALVTDGFTPFIATLRACLRHAGGVRIDHAMGLLRLWVVPRGADPHEGAYLSYPIDDLLRLTALESHRHRAIVIGEDLGTVPASFRQRLAGSGIYGMRVLWFARKRNSFIASPAWSKDAAAMTSTHDLPTIAGWWRGTDIATRSELDLVAHPDEEKATRAKDRQRLWQAFRRARAASGETPPPDETTPVADAAAHFIAQTPSELALLPLEDALGLKDQPNLPGTIQEHPNWRRRYPGDAAQLLAAPPIRQRLRPLARRGVR